MQVKVLPVDGTAALPTASGTAERLVADHTAGAGPALLSRPAGADLRLGSCVLRRRVLAAHAGAGAHG